MCPVLLGLAGHAGIDFLLVVARGVDARGSGGNLAVAAVIASNAATPIDTRRGRAISGVLNEPPCNLLGSLKSRHGNSPTMPESRPPWRRPDAGRAVGGGLQVLDYSATAGLPFKAPRYAAGLRGGPTRPGATRCGWPSASPGRARPRGRARARRRRAAPAPCTGHSAQWVSRDDFARQLNAWSRRARLRSLPLPGQRGDTVGRRAQRTIHAAHRMPRSGRAPPGIANSRCCSRLPCSKGSCASGRPRAATSQPINSAPGAGLASHGSARCTAVADRLQRQPLEARAFLQRNARALHRGFAL